MNRRDFDDILSECIERVVFQGEPLEQCLAAYPRYRKELELLLQTALTVRRATDTKPRLVYKAVAGYRFEQAVKEVLDRRGSRTYLLWGWSRRWATALVLLLLVLLSAGTVMAAGDSLPDETLYPVKTTAEVIQEALTFGEVNQAQLNIHFAENRVKEIEALTRRGDTEGVVKLTQKWEKHLEKAEKFVPLSQKTEMPVAPGSQAAPGPSAPAPSRAIPRPTVPLPPGAPQVRAALRRGAPQQIALLEQALVRAPERERPALSRELQKLVARYQEALREEAEGEQKGNGD
ncbi:MAG: hypothetical protein HY687_05935 [Chloroflexi bacterium]|nr:hypothetical protein [Chloroflexota bacterium]